MIKHILIIVLCSLLLNPAFADDKIIAIALTTSITDKNKNKALAQTAQLLFQQYAQTHHLTPTKADLSQYQKFLTLGAQLNRNQFNNKLEQLTQLETSRELTKEEQSTKEKYTRYLAHIDDDGSFNLTQPPEYIIATIQRWKVNQALYNKYGGGVVFQQAGLEPIDAWHAFFKQQVHNGHLIFHDQEFEQYFWDTFTPKKNHWSYDAKPNDAFKQPYWVIGLTTLTEEINAL